MAIDRVTYLATLEAHLDGRFSPHTKRSFLGHARRFLELTGQRSIYERNDVLGFVKYLIDHGYKSESIKTILAAVKVLFDVNGLAWPLEKRDLHGRLPPSESEAPVLAPIEIARLIVGVRSTAGFPRTVVALATIYGLRTDEIQRVLTSGCDGLQLVIQTAKGGEKRSHRIPEALAPMLACPPTKVSTRGLHDVFERLMVASVRKPIAREGWHAVRRSVVTALVEAGIPVEKIHKWMGWKEMEKQNIAFRYFKPNRLELDKEVYGKHPYLRMWIL